MSPELPVPLGELLIDLLVPGFVVVPCMPERERWVGTCDCWGFRFEWLMPEDELPPIVPVDDEPDDMPDDEPEVPPGEV